MSQLGYRLSVQRCEWKTWSSFYYHQGHVWYQCECLTGSLPFFFPLVKHLLEQQEKLIWSNSMDTSGLTEIQTLQEKINKLIRHGQVQAVNGNFEKHSLGSKSWWSTVNPLKCRKPTNTPISLIISLNEINNFFCTVDTDPLNKPKWKRVCLWPCSCCQPHL